MKHLFEHWNEVESSLAERNIFLFLDFDGTLAEIARRPEEAFLTENNKNSLNDLLKNKRFKIALISGRQLNDLKQKAAGKELAYAGNHGMEIEGAGFSYRHQVGENYLDTLNILKQKLTSAFAGRQGVLIEDKNIGLCVHYRMADQKSMTEVPAIIREICTPFLKTGSIKTKPGKMVVEIIPPANWTKGNAVEWLMERQKESKKDFFPVYLGDDLTDEDAFKIVKKDGLAVLVGPPKNSHAPYQLNNIAEVESFLQRIDC